MSANVPQGTYFKNSLGLKKEIEGEVAADYSSRVVEALRAHGYRVDLPGLGVRLAKEFGFCYGVDKAIDMAYEAHRKFPDRRIFLTTELIHNPVVNEKMMAMGIRFLNGMYACGLTPDDIRADDVIVLPAFGVGVEELALYRNKGCIIVDTTCGSVVHVWKRVEKYAKDGFTSLIHGKYFHEETIATTSHAAAHGGAWIVVRDKRQAQVVCDVITGRRPATDLAAEIPKGLSPGFDPARHLERMGAANQTTMLASESLEIAAMAGAAMAERHGEEEAKKRFRSFDTICSATQERQDAIRDLIAGGELDVLIVIGGYNSSNTNHLLEMGFRANVPTYHICDAREIVSATTIRHKPAGAKEAIEAAGWLPAGEAVIGITAGASTPNRAIGETLERIAALRGISQAELLAAIEAQPAPQA